MTGGEREATAAVGRLDGDAVAAVDSTDQAGDMLGLAEQLRDALWRVDSAGITPGAVSYTHLTLPTTPYV